MYSALDIAKWFLFKDNAEAKQNEFEEEPYERITNLKLQKLLYYAQGINLAIYDEPLFTESIEAWPHGPVVREVYNKYSIHKGNPIIIKTDSDDEEKITKIEQDNKANNVLNLTYNNFAIYTAWQLRNMTHKDGSPWDITQKNKGLFMVIDNDDIGKYFKKEVVE